MISKKIIYTYFLFFLLSMSAQGDDGWAPPAGDPGFGGGSGDAAVEPLETPIDGLELPLLITGFAVAFFIFNNKQNVSRL